MTLGIGFFSPSDLLVSAAKSVGVVDMSADELATDTLVGTVVMVVAGGAGLRAIFR